MAFCPLNRDSAPRHPETAQKKTPPPSTGHQTRETSAHFLSCTKNRQSNSCNGCLFCVQFNNFGVGTAWSECYRYDVAVNLMSFLRLGSWLRQELRVPSEALAAPHSRDRLPSFNRERKMLVLSRKTSERILIGDDIAITVVRIGPNSVRIGIEAPKTMNIVREELCDFSSGNRNIEPRSTAVPSA